METINIGEPQASQEEKNQNEASPAGLSAESAQVAEKTEDKTGQGENSAPKAPNNRKKKLIWAGIILAVLILAVLGWQYWQYTHSVYYQQMKAVKEWGKMAKESEKWGGKTPEETVKLFTEAVKKGDFDLASKYGSSELIKPELEKMKADNQIDLLVRELETGKIEEIPGFGGDHVNLIADIDGLRVRVLSMGKSDGGTWKIDEF